MWVFNILMGNQTFFEDFQLSGISCSPEMRPLLFIVFCSIYFAGILWNTVIITVVSINTRLHIPMYLFLSNLSFIDICFPTITLTKLMDILLTDNNSISFIQCYIQMYFIMFVGVTEIFLLSSMAYDRYVAICKPLHYHLIMSNRQCIMFLGVTWIFGCLNSFFITYFVSTLPFCHLKNIQHFYCEVKALSRILCVNTGLYIVMYLETLIVGLSPFLLSIISYSNIIATILHIKSIDGRKKAFSTCTSHLAVLTIFYGSIMSIYLKPSSEQVDTLDQFFSVMYTAVTPMLNPLIYSLRNEEVKRAAMRLVMMVTKPCKLGHSKVTR